MPGRQPLDLIGLLLIAAATLTFMLPFLTTSTGQPDPLGQRRDLGRRPGADRPDRWWCLALSAALFLALLSWERRYQRRTGHAVLDPAVLGQASFRNGALLGTAYFAGFTPLFLVVTLFLQGVLGYGALQAGLVTAPWAAVAACTAWRSGRWVTRWGRGLVVVGLIFVTTGVAAAAGAVYLLADTSPGALGWVMAVCLAIAGLGSGLVISPNQALTLAAVPVNRAGVAGSTQQLGQRVGGAVGAAVILAIHTASKTTRPASATVISLIVIATMVGGALTIGVYDGRHRSRQQRPASPG